MKKIKIPRKLKKYANKILARNENQFPNVPKLKRYYYYLNIEWGIKNYGLSPEELYYAYGKFTLDDVIWWHWVRKKEFGIEPNMSPKFQKYWDFFKSKGCL